MNSPYCPKTPKITTSEVDPGFVYPYDDTGKLAAGTNHFGTDKTPGGRKVLRKSATASHR